MRILHLTLKKKWFDLIASGEKKEEYREHNSYWGARLVKKGYWHSQVCKEFDIVIFRNGYSKNAPMIKVECLGIKLHHGDEPYHPGWGAEQGMAYYVITLGKILKKPNCGSKIEWE